MKYDMYVQYAFLIILYRHANKPVLCDITHLQTYCSHLLAASENTAIWVLAKHQHTLSEPYVHLTPLSDVWHFSSITFMTDSSLILGVARSNMEKIHHSSSMKVIDRKTKSWIKCQIGSCVTGSMMYFKINFVLLCCTILYFVTHY